MKKTTNNLHFFLTPYKGTKGVKMDSTSKTIQEDSMSVKEMMQKHVQGVLDPSMYHDAQFDSDDIDHDTDVSHRSQKTELDALVYAEEHGMTEQQVKDHLEALQDTEIPEPIEEVQEDSSEPSEAPNASE